VDMADLERSLRESLEAFAQGGHSPLATRLSEVEAHMWPAFQALPKNDMGRLGPRAVRYLVHNYFAAEHGWLVNGLEPHGHQDENVAEVHEAHILSEKAPAFVETLLEARRSDRGLSLSDAAVLAVALERLILNESSTLLQAAYSLNGKATSSELDEQEIHEILTSYLLIFERGQKVNLTDSVSHRKYKKAMSRLPSGTWPVMVEFERDAVKSYDDARRGETTTVQDSTYSFSATSSIVEKLAHGYGKWQNRECQQMKQDLMSMDTDGRGSVPLESFYSKRESGRYQFEESVEYLKAVGAIDESGAGRRVRIANYLTGPSNCIATSTFYSVCCLNEGNAIMSELEGRLRSPTAPAQAILGALQDMSSHKREPLQLQSGMMQKLEGIAARHGGAVPLHGRLFAQWLHLVFPTEVPYPHVVEETSMLSPKHWVGRKIVTTAAERREELQQERAMAASGQAADSELAWTDEEALPVQEPLGQPRMASLLAWARGAAQAALLLVVLRAALTAAGPAAAAFGLDRFTAKGAYGRAKKNDMVLPF